MALSHGSNSLGSLSGQTVESGARKLVLPLSSVSDKCVIKPVVHDLICCKGAKNGLNDWNFTAPMYVSGKSWQSAEVDLQRLVTCSLQMHSMLSNWDCVCVCVCVCVCGVCGPAVSGRKQLCDRICTCSWHLTHDYYKWDPHLIAANSFQMDSQIWDNSETSALFSLPVMIFYWSLFAGRQSKRYLNLNKYIKIKLNILTNTNLGKHILYTVT